MVSELCPNDVHSGMARALPAGVVVIPKHLSILVLLTSTLIIASPDSGFISALKWCMAQQRYRQHARTGTSRLLDFSADTFKN